MNQSELIFCAFRYCLGRMTYIVSQMCDYLVDHWTDIEPAYQKMIHKEIEEALELGRAGMEQDQDSWIECLKRIDEIELKECVDD